MDTHSPQIAERPLASTAKRGIHLWYELLLEPRSGDERIRRQEFILDVILIGIIAVFGALFFLTGHNESALGNDYQGFSDLEHVLIFLAFIGLLAASRLGFVRFASITLIVICFLITAYTSARWGVGIPTGLLGFAITITAAMILVGVRFGILVSLGIVITLGFLAWQQEANGIVSMWREQPISDSIGYSLMLVVITVLSWLYNREISRSLDKALASEADLKRQNESLEEIVSERTKELKSEHTERVSEMYRFVEFGRLAAGVFHDIINPLTAISLNIEDLQRSVDSGGSDIKEAVAQASMANRRIERFVTAASKQIRSESPAGYFSAEEELGEVVSVLDYKAKKRGTDISISVPDDIILFGDRIKFNQIASNLISNAIDSYEGMSPDIRHTVSVSLSSDGGKAVLKISDTGRGMTADTTAKIFEPFYTTKQYGKGIGLGLSTTKHLVENDFGGTISVSSEPGRGSAFTVSLPLPNRHETDTAERNDRDTRSDLGGYSTHPKSPNP